MHGRPFVASLVGLLMALSAIVAVAQPPFTGTDEIETDRDSFTPATTTVGNRHYRHQGEPRYWPRHPRDGNDFPYRRWVAASHFYSRDPVCSKTSSVSADWGRMLSKYRRMVCRCPSGIDSELRTDSLIASYS